MDKQGLNSPSKIPTQKENLIRRIIKNQVVDILVLI